MKIKKNLLWKVKKCVFRLYVGWKDWIAQVMLFCAEVKEEIFSQTAAPTNFRMYIMANYFFLKKHLTFTLWKISLVCIHKYAFFVVWMYSCLIHSTIFFYRVIKKRVGNSHHPLPPSLSLFLVYLFKSPSLYYSFNLTYYVLHVLWYSRIFDEKLLYFLYFFVILET